MNVTRYEQGVEKSVEKGQRKLLRELLEDRFGPLPEAVQERLQQLPAEQLSSLGKALMRAQSLRELGLED